MPSTNPASGNAPGLSLGASEILSTDALSSKRIEEFKRLFEALSEQDQIHFLVFLRGLAAEAASGDPSKQTREVLQ